MYIASADRTANVNWLGEAPLAELAQQIAHARGPSGPNNEYLYKLADVMRQASGRICVLVCPDRQYVFLLCGRLRAAALLMAGGVCVRAHERNR